MLGVVTGIVLQFSLDGNCLRVRLLELSYYGVGDYSGNGAVAYSGNHFGNWGESVRFGLSWSTFLKCVLFWGDGEGRGGIFHVFYVFF